MYKGSVRCFFEEDVDNILGIIVAEITSALDNLAPMKSILVKDWLPPSSFTLSVGGGDSIGAMRPVGAGALVNFQHKP